MNGTQSNPLRLVARWFLTADTYASKMVAARCLHNLLCRSRMDDEQETGWITLENGEHVLVDKENDEVLGGAGGALTGKTLGYADKGQTREARMSQMDKAFKAKDAKQFDSKYREKSGKIWQGLSSREKSSVHSYTNEGYIRINGALRGDARMTPQTKECVGHLTDAISQSTLQEDTVLYRGMDIGAFGKLFNIDPDSITEENVSDLIGLEGTDDAFTSTGCHEGARFQFFGVDVDIFAPKGTEALYVEPFSEFGCGDRREWDGVSGQEEFSVEQETLVQRGTSFQIFDAQFVTQYDDFEEEDVLTLKVKVAITGQKYK